MTSPRKAVSYLRHAMWALALLLPLISLVALGSVWLFQNGVLLIWALIACLVTCGVYLLEYALLRRLAQETPELPARDAGTAPDPGWTPREQEAWEAVKSLSRQADPNKIDSVDALLELGRQTLEAVARTLHPQKPDPLLAFTVPEALALVEQVSRRLRPFIVENVPLGDRLTVGQLLKLYSWRTVIDYAEQAYDLWRIVRLLNPATAATQEIRERISKKMYEMGREHLARTLMEHYVEEVGRAGIDLYGGRLKVSPEVLERHVSAATRRDREEMAARVPEPLRILVGGQVNAGKSSLINALSEEIRAAADPLPSTTSFPAYELVRDGLPAAHIIDSPGVDGRDTDPQVLAQVASACDLILWVVNATRADRDLDRSALDGIRRYFAERPDRRRPPMMMVVSHIDRLRPFQEWSPPYDLVAAGSPKAQSIRAAVQAAGADLDFPPGDIVPACLASPPGLYNVDAIWAQIVSLLPEAQRAQLVRRLGEARAGFEWSRLWSQMMNAGRVLTRSLTR
jgi:predicted GTPase